MAHTAAQENAAATKQASRDRAVVACEQPERGAAAAAEEAADERGEPNTWRPTPKS